MGCSITVDNSEKEGGETEMQKRGGGGREDVHTYTKSTSVVSGRPANTEFAPDGVVIDLRVYGCWNGGAV